MYKYSTLWALSIKPKCPKHRKDPTFLKMKNHDLVLKKPELA